MCNNCHQYFYKLSNFFLVLTILLSLYFLILYLSLYDDLDNSNKSLTNFFDEAINNLNYSEINISLLNSEDIIESDSDLNLTVEDLIFEKVSNKSDEFKKECDIFKGCFKATLAFTILNSPALLSVIGSSFESLLLHAAKTATRPHTATVANIPKKFFFIYVCV